MNMMQVLCFLAAGRCLNFTQAAKDLYISQPALSRNIALLEKEWNLELFSRSNKQAATRLTPAGSTMFEGMRHLYGQYENLLKNARSIQDGKTGLLRIGFLSGNRIDDQALEIIDRFQDAYPDIELSYRRGSHSELISWLFDYTLDLVFALKIDIEDKNWIAARPIYLIDSVLLLPARHPLLAKGELSLIDFKDETFLNIAPAESPAIHTLLLRECEKAGFIPKVHDVANIAEQVLYLESGKGVAIGSINNAAAFNTNITMTHLNDLKPQQIMIAWSRENLNPVIAQFQSCYELIE